MSVLIKGMEMPVTCCHCPLMGYDPDREWYDSMARTGAHVCVLTGELIDNTKREDHCPLVHVPEHGRLIDADAELERLKHCMFQSDMATTTAVGMYEKWLKNTPTIIPAEEGE